MATNNLFNKEIKGLKYIVVNGRTSSIYNPKDCILQLSSHTDYICKDVLKTRVFNVFKKGNPFILADVKIKASIEYIDVLEELRLKTLIKSETFPLIIHTKFKVAYAFNAFLPSMEVFKDNLVSLWFEGI